MKELEHKFIQLVREHRSTIYTVCYMFSNAEEDVQDLFQEVIVNLWLGYDKFKGHSSAKTWVYRVALNTCISIDRKQHRRVKTLPLTNSFNLFEDSDDDTRQISQLHERIGRLQPVDRALILLWLENLSYEEIAQITGFSIKNVSIRLYRIKERLKQMNDDGTE